MKLNAIAGLLLFFAIVTLPITVLAEGSNEVWVDKPNAETKLHLCNDFVNFCNAGGDRTQFAVYGCNQRDRLYFEVQDSTEVVYIGLNSDDWQNQTTSFCVYQIRALDGTIVQPEMVITEIPGDVGHIDDIGQAREGPQQLGAAAGYNAHIFYPPDTGTYYIEFDRQDQNGFQIIDDWQMYLFDVTIADSVTNIVETGRLHSQGWQYYDRNLGFNNWTKNSSTFFVYSTDSIITSVTFEDLEGRAWIMFCNDRGCRKTGDFEEDRKSLDSERAYVPKYPIFLNEPDPDLFPPASTTGQIIPPITMDTYCDSGVVVFNVEVDKAANLEIFLDFDDPYVDRSLPAAVVVGVNQIMWDGLDGVGVPVPNNAFVTFSVSYINGLTHLPLYDIELNEYGFRIELISPVGPVPLVYWDDSNIPGGTTNFTGCLSVPPEPGCHDWDQVSYGDYNTINTWWFSASETTIPLTIQQMRSADTLVFNQVLPQIYCAGVDTLFFSVANDPNTEVYHWSYTGTGATIIHNNPADTFIVIQMAPGATSGNVEVYGTNTNCPAPGPVASLAITIDPIPVPEIAYSPNDTVCINDTVYFYGSDTVGLTIVSWYWDFGDGGSDTTQNTSHVYTSTLTDTVKLIVISDAGCTDTAEMLIWVVDPSIDFTMNPSPSCVGDTVWFYGTGDVTFTEWYWDFGDGDTATGDTVFHIYTTWDTFNVNLSVCSKDTSYQHIVHQPASTDAGSDETVCEYGSFDFSTSVMLPAVGQVDSLLWFGGTGFFNDPRLLMPVYTPGPGELGDVTLFLIGYSHVPCSNDTSFMVLHVIDGPEPDFTYTPSDSICVNEPILFNGTSTTNITSWDWDFGDGIGTASGQNVSYAYSAEGFYDVSLVATNDSACADTISYQLQIYRLPVASIAVLPDTAICAMDTVIFNGSSTTNVIEWEWDFGDGNSDTGQNVTHIYPIPGIYNVRLNVLNANSCVDTVYQQIVIDTLPIADFTINPPDTACTDETVYFSASGSANIAIWHWDFGDGTPPISGGNPNRNHAYTIPGNYTIMVVAENIYGCYDTVWRNLEVVDISISFTMTPDPSCEDYTVTFTGIGDASFTDWIWGFGDGNTDTGKIVTHVYPNPGSYPIALTVCSEQVLDTLIVHPQVINDAGTDEMICEYEPFDFSNSATPPTATDYDNVVWSGGLGTFNDPTLVVPVYTPAAGELGPITLTMIAYGISPCYNDTSSMVLHVIDSPEVDFTYSPNDSICVDEPILFNGSSSTNIVSWAWDFGDGSPTATGQNVSYAYPVDGIYDVSLIVINDSACTDTAIYTLVIHVLPSASIAVIPGTTICAEEELTFNGSSTTNIISWDWDFGDGNIASGQNVTHTYPAPGSYTVELIVLNENSCQDTATQLIIIDALPTTDFTMSPNDTSCVGEVVSFDGTGSADIISWDWDFGDGNIASGQNVTHTYTAGGTYNVSLIVANANGCLDTAIHQRVLIDLTIDFTMTPDPACENFVVSFNGIGNASFTPWNWDFGDGNTATGQNVTHTYTTANTYTVTLDVCSETATYQLIVNPEALANAGSDTATCEDVWFDLSTKTVPPSASNYSSILWYGGTGTFDDPTAIAPIYTPGAGELGFVTLYMVANGISPCYNDTSTMALEVIEGAYAQAGSDEHSCVDVPYDFATSSFVPFATNYITLQWSGGAGSFVDPTVQVPVYIPGPGETGAITLTVLALGVLNCDSIDDMVLTIHPDYLMPFDTTICYKDSVFAQGNWQLGSGTFYDTLLSVWGCDSVIQTNLTVRPEIDRDFTITPNDSTCIDEPVYFTQTGTANLTTWFWDFGDGATSNAQDPNHQYATPGLYTVTLTYTDDNGCSDFKEHNVFVFNHPDVDFYTSQTSACINAQFSFNGLSNDNIIDWFWDLGDGTTANTQNVSHIYTTYGLFQVTLTVTADNGCMSSVTKPMVVAQPPNADFEYYVVSCDTIQFTDLSTSPPGYYLVEWQWDFGDGGTSDLQNPWHVYNTSGVMLVTLIVSADSAGNICNDTITLPVSVPVQPTVYFTWDPEPTCLGNSTSFFGTSGNSIASWYWDFGDGNFATVQDPVHMYTYADSFNVILMVTDMNGCSDTTMHTVTVNDIPDVDFTVDPNPACQDNQTSFSGISTATITNWSWDFGDGGTGFGQNTTHSYATTGTFTVVLTVTDSTGCTNNISYPVSVSPPPTANFTTTSPACSADSVHFQNYSTTPNGYIQEWEWDFGDGTVITVAYPADPDISHQYASGGTYTVTLTILDSDSCTNLFSQEVVIESSPIADFNNTPGCLGEAVDFTDLSSPNGGSVIVLWFWEFDDPASGSNTSTQQNPTHLFSGFGTYDVILVISNVAGCADTLIKSIEVYDLPPVDFTMDSDTVCIGNEITFTSMAATASTYLWDFGDGGTSVLRDPVYVYTDAGTYTVTLTVNDGNGCTNSASHDVTVDPLPWASYTSSAPACTSTPVLFTDLSSATSGFLTEWHWYFGDGTDTIVLYPDDPNVYHSYATAGDYTATLVVTSSAGCVDSTDQDLSILQGPEALFTYDGSSCEGSALQFTDMSNAFGSTIGSWQWNFGDPSSGANNTSSLQNPTHSYAQQGSYTVTLTVTLTEGCLDVTTQDITITPPPPVYYTMDPPQSCLADVTYFFTDPDSTNIAQVSSYLWDFGDPGSGANNLSTLQDPTHVFTMPGTYDVTLTIADLSGCENMILRQVSVNNKPTADYSYELPCVSDSTQFFDGSIGSGAGIAGWFWDFDDPSTAPNNTSNLQDPRHMFSAMGTYTVMLIVTDINGCMDTTYKTIEVSDAPTSAFRFHQACDPPGTVFFTDSSWAGTSGQPIVAWEWELEPGYFSYEVNPQYTYNYTDSCYYVNLKVTDQHGCESMSTRQVCVNDPLSVAFTGSDVCMGERAAFSASYLPSNDSILQWSWDFGDGTTVIHTSNDTISHSYTVAGTYLVTLTAVNTDNCESSTYEEMRVNALPEPDFASSSAKCDEPTEFTDLSSSPGSIITSWHWDFGDGTYSTAQNPTHTYGPEDSTYTVTLTLTNAEGCTDSLQREVIKGVCVQALFDLTSTSPCNDHDVCFVDHSFVYADEYPLTRWTWDFGDGTTQTYTSYQDSTCHVYGGSGAYEVTLIVTALVHGVENYDSTTRDVVIASSPTSDFASSKPCINSNTLFTDLTNGHGSVITLWSWNFGDISSTQDTSTQQNPTYSYTNPGTYTVELVTENNYGCVDTLREELEIFMLPEADFSYNLPCEGKVTLFTDETIAGQAAFDQWSWNFGDANSTHDTSNLQNPGYIYDQQGNYTVQLSVMDDNTCEDITSRVIEVYPSPESDFTTVSNYGGIQGQIMCENLSAGAILYEWDFGNGLTSELENPVTVYEANGTYVIELISRNEYECADTTYQEYEVVLQGLYVPNAFIPEGDIAELKIFKPVGKGLKSYSITIFNKWGSVVWSSTKLDGQGSPAEGWDGTVDGDLMPIGDYVWNINAQFETGHTWSGSDAGDGNEKTSGTVTLIR